MMPTVEQLVAAQNAINAQHPYLARIPDGEKVDVTLTAEHLATIASALGVATTVGLEARKPAHAQLGWAAIIDAGLMARGSARLCSESLRALERIDLGTLERMAALVLGDRGELGPRPRPDTPAELTHSLDMLLAEYLLEHPAALPSQTSVLALLKWNGDRMAAFCREVGR